MIEVIISQSPIVAHATGVCHLSGGESQEVKRAGHPRIAVRDGAGKLGQAQRIVWTRMNCPSALGDEKPYQGTTPEAIPGSFDASHPLLARQCKKGSEVAHCLALFLDKLRDLLLKHGREEPRDTIEGTPGSGEYRS
jgi:hypothetical protein